MTNPPNDLPLQVTGVFIRLGTDSESCRPQQAIHIRIETISTPQNSYIAGTQNHAWVEGRVEMYIHTRANISSSKQRRIICMTSTGELQCRNELEGLVWARKTCFQTGRNKCIPIMVRICISLWELQKHVASKSPLLLNVACCP